MNAKGKKEKELEIASKGYNNRRGLRRRDRGVKKSEIEGNGEKEGSREMEKARSSRWKRKENKKLTRAGASGTKKGTRGTREGMEEGNDEARQTEGDNERGTGDGKRGRRG